MKPIAFSWWLWCISILYWFNIISYSPLLPLMFAIIVASYLILYRFRREYHWTTQIFILSLEFLFAYIAYAKNPKRPLFNMPDLLFNSVLLLVYLIHLKQHRKTTFYELYFIKFPQYHKNETLYEHFKRRIVTGFQVCPRVP